MQPYRDEIYSNSRVHGNWMLGVVSVSSTTTTNYYGYITNCGMVPGIAFSQGCRERISGLVVITTIYVYAISLFNATIINCWFLLSYAARPFEDASLR